MLFLFNDAVFDIGDPEETALAADQPLAPEALRKLTPGKAVKLLREAIFHSPALARANPDKAAFLAALIAWKSGEANTLLAVCPPGADDPMQVQVRLASVSLITLHQLAELQSMGKLSSHAVNLTVWNHAPKRLRA